MKQRFSLYLIEKCPFTVGDAVGGTKKPIGWTRNEDHCAVLVRGLEPNANAATWGYGHCYAQFGATCVNGNEEWRTCRFLGEVAWLPRLNIFSYFLDNCTQYGIFDVRLLYTTKSLLSFKKNAHLSSEMELEALQNAWERQLMRMNAQIL